MSNTIIDLVEKLKENKNNMKDFADVLNTNANLSREIMLGDIDEDTGEAVESVIRFWNRYDDEKEKEFYVKASNQEIIPGFFKREPIKIYIDSYGGCMTATFTMIDAIKKSPILNEIANKKGKTIGQVILRWHYQHQSVPCFKSLKPKRLAENFDIWDFELTHEEMAAINSMDCDYKYHLESASCPGF